MTSGVYTITNIQTAKVYVGSSKNIEKRFQQHENLLNNGSHHSRKLQKEWDEYGKAAFAFRVLEEVEESINLLEVEQQFIDQYKSWQDYNVHKKAVCSKYSGNPSNPECPDCGERTRHKRTNQDGQDIYDCSRCGWSNSKRRIPRSPALRRKELNAIVIRAAIEFYSQDTYRGSYIDLADVIGGDRWLYSCDQLVKDLQRVNEDKKQWKSLTIHLQKP